MMNETSRPDKPVMIYRKTAILQKNGIFAAVGVYSYLDALHAVASFDPKGKQHYRNSFETRTAAVTSFETSVATSRDRGWTVAWNAAPNNSYLS